MSAEPPSIGGEVAPGFEAVRDAFVRNLTQLGDVGAAVCAFHKGRKVVDLWGGVADPDTGAPYDANTLQLVFSSTKGATAAVAAILAERDLIDFDAPVADYWPEFAAAGKESITVRDLLSHRAGLAAFDERISVEDFLAWEPAVQRLASQAPNWPLGTAHGYHALTFGHLVGEVVRRVTGRSLGEVFASEVAGPLGLEFFIGLPASLEERVSPLRDFVMPPPGALPNGSGGIGLSPVIVAMTTKGTLTHRVFSRPPLRIPGFNDRVVHAAEVPAANGITNAVSLAKMYAAMVGEVDGVRLLSPEQVERVRAEQSAGDDLVLCENDRFGLGFMLDCGRTPLSSPSAFGHSGMGGSLGFADPDLELGFGYVMNQCVAYPGVDPRTEGLIGALRSAVA